MAIVTNPVYQAAIRELEAILSPRVVSRSLKEGMRQLGRTADDIDASGLESILKSQIYRQLQVTMPVVQAKQTITGIIERLHALPAAGDDTVAESDDPDPSLTPALEQQALTLDRLQESLKPYNLYFEWAEVQKLRAQLQLLEEEQEQGREAPMIIAEAEIQLDTVTRMLEDHLVIQARELGELREALEQVRTLGGPKVRRLENLVHQIDEQQQQRQLATAEIERAHKLSRDLRKLMESSVYAEDPTAILEPVEGGVLEVENDDDVLLSIDTANLDPEVSARLLLLDLEAERHDLDAFEAEHANLLSFEAELVAELAELRGQLDEDNSIDGRLGHLGTEFEQAAAKRRETLLRELEAMEGELEAMRDAIDTSELRQAIQVVKGILSTTLPHRSDIEHVRHVLDLHRLTFAQSDEIARLERESQGQRLALLREQTELLARLESTVLSFRDSGGDDPSYLNLARGLEDLRSATAAERTVPDLVAEVRRAEVAFEAALAARSDDPGVRERSHLRALLGRVERTPVFEALAERRASIAAELHRHLDSLGDERRGSSQLAGLEALVANLELEVKVACQRRLEELAPLVADLGADMLQRLKGASDMLDRGEYPDLVELERVFVLARESRRSDQMDDLHALEREAKPFEMVDTEANDRLREMLSAIRSQAAAGRLTGDLARAWSLLEQVKSIVERRLADFEPRLDAALDAFGGVAMLNSEDVAKVRRTLQHLDSQRGAIERVSISLRSQLERDLQGAETLIAKLQEEFEATRAIADQLVSGNVLDDVLNIFGHGEIAPAPAAVPAGDPIAALLEDLAAERGVRTVLAMREGGPAVAGRSTLDETETSAALAGLEARLLELGHELDVGRPHRVTIETSQGVAIAAWPLPDRGLLVLLDDPAVLSLILHRLRQEEERLRTLLRTP